MSTNKHKPVVLDRVTLNALAIAGSTENTHAIESLILWLDDNVNLEGEITFSNEWEPVVRSEQALIALKALLPQFEHLHA